MTSPARVREKSKYLVQWMTADGWRSCEVYADNQRDAIELVKSNYHTGKRLSAHKEARNG